jgi:hypothetical protein
VAALPKVDATAVKQCEPAFKQATSADAKADELAIAARCLRAAGSLGAAIQLWRSLIQFHLNVEGGHGGALRARTGVRGGGAVRGRRDMEPHVREEVRSREGRGRAHDARRLPVAAAGLRERRRARLQAPRRSVGRKHKLDAATLCDQVQPIIVPPKSSPARP